MLAQLLQETTARLQAMHRDQGGAVALMCMAAMIILFMMSMVIIDSGMVAREKIQTQIAADTASYSHASVRARTMNMIAYTNVAKRSIVGIHAIYVAAWQAYLAWYFSLFPKCFRWFPDISACIKIIRNTPVVLGEGLGDWMKVSGLPIVPLVIGGATKSGYNKEMNQLTRYQKYMLKLTPWWAYMEASVRGSRNGATFTVSWPPPKGLSSSVTGFVQTVTSILQSFGLFRKTGRQDDMEQIYQFKGGITGICMAIAPWEMIMDPAFGIEMAANVAIQATRSYSDAKRFSGTGMATGWVNCMITHAIGAMKGADSGYYKFKNYNDRKSRGSMMISYKNAPMNMGRYSENFKVANAWSQYQTSQNAIIPDHSSGPWALSHNEVVQLGSRDQWHTNWTGRLRPVQADRSYTVDLNGAYHDVLPFLGVQTLVGLAQGVDTSSAIKDFIAFEKATRVLDTQTKDGLVK